MRQFSFSIFLLLVITVSVQSQNMTFIRHPIDLDFDGIHRIKAIDLDGDLDLDIVGGSEITPFSASKGLAWWRNEGNNGWTRFSIDASFIHVMSVDTADINNDSFTDIIASSWQLHQIVWLKNNGDPTQGWTKYVVKSGLTNAHDAQCADIDADGDFDIVGVGSTPGRIILCENSGILSNWSSTIINSSFGGALSAYIIDLDNDSHLDIVGTASNLNQLAWWKNNGSNPIGWTKKIIDSNFEGASGIDIIDMNNDDQKDVISNAWKSNQVAYWICENILNNSWTKYLVSNQLDTAAGVQCRDLDQDGDIDIVAVGKIPGELVIYENSGFSWNKIQLQDNFYGGTALDIADIDQDGDDDIIAGASYIGDLFWWENTLITSLDNTSTSNNIPRGFYVKNYPNPFNPLTNIEYYLTESSTVILKIYNVLGKEIRTLVNNYQVKGIKTILWDSKDDYGNDVGSGIYYFKLLTEFNYECRKMLLLK